WFTLIGFFASFCRALPFPHSFPTRRSSDLVGVVALGEVGAVVGAAALLALDAAAGDDLGEDEHVAQGAGEAEGLVGPAGGVAEADRKSTRLNSSHVKISYAVFCLKKKTTLT